MNRKIRKPNNSPVQSETLSLIKQQFFKTKMCPFQKNKNYCLNESNCHYAHSLEELKPMPNLRNTKLCEYVKKKLPCQNPNCKFAHDIDMLKPSVHLATYKSAICSFWGKGKCFNGNKCRFAHGNEDMKSLDELNKTMNSIKTESTPNQPVLSISIHQKNRNGLKKKNETNNNNVGNLNGSTHNNPTMKGNTETDICNSSTNSFHTCEHFARGSAETTNAFGELIKQEQQEEKINQSSLNKDNWMQNRKNNNTLDIIKEGTNIWGTTDESKRALGEEINEHRNIDYNKFIGDEGFCDNENNNNSNNNNNTNHLLTNTYALYKNSMNNVNTTMHTKKNINNLNRSNSNSMKDIIERMENMKISSYLENSDNYTETIKYLVRENAKLKQSLRNDYSTDMNMEKDFQNKNGKQFSLDLSAAGNNNNASPMQMNCNDITKYFYTDEKQTNERYLNNVESQNGNLMNVATFEDTSNGDENLCNIIKTIDDILISHNVDSFSNIKNDSVDVRKDSSIAFENTKDTLQGNSNTLEVFNGYENFFYNMKSFDTAKNDCSDSNSNSNSNSILPMEKKNSKDTDILEQLFQQSIQSDQPEKKKNYFYQDNNAHTINRTEDYFAKRKSFQQEEMQTKKYEEFFQKNNFKVHPFQQTIQQNMQQNMQPNMKSNLDLQQSIHKFLQSEQNRKEEISYNRDSCDVNQEEFIYMRNNGNPLQMYSQNMNQTQMFSQGMNQPIQNNTGIKNVYKEKNTKLNSTEQDNLLMNDTSLNTEKLFELFSDKTQLIKKLKMFLSTELKNSENQKYTSSTKINNFSNMGNDNRMINNKNNYFNDSLYSMAFNNNVNLNSNSISNSNVNEIMNNNINYNNNNNNNNNNYNNNNNVNMNMNRTIDMNSINNKYESHNNSNNGVNNSDMPLYEMEMNMDKNIWNNVNSNMNNNMNTNTNNIKIKNINNHSSSCNSIISNNFNSAQLNEYTHPNYSSEWINNNDNLDFYNLPKSINMSRLN